MAFEFTLADGDNLTEIYSKDDTVFVLKIGQDLAKERLFSLQASMTIIAAAPADHREFMFAIIETDFDGNYIASYTDGLETIGILASNEERAAVLHSVAFALSLLANNLRPRVITMITCETYLPPKALRKYDLVFDVLNQIGYDARRGDPQLGTEIWLAKDLRNEQ